MLFHKCNLQFSGQKKSWIAPQKCKLQFASHFTRNRPPPSQPRGARLGFGNHSSTFRILGFMGRRHPGVTTTSTGSIRTDTSTVASWPHTVPRAGSSPTRSHRHPKLRLATAWLATHRRRGRPSPFSPQLWRRRCAGERMATQSSYSHTHSIPSWSPRSAWPREPSAARTTNRATRQPSIHHNPIPQWQQLPEPPLPPASLAAPPIATALICPLLPVPSHSRPSWRPPRGLCAVWTFASTGGGHGTGSSPHMQGSGGTGNNKHPPGRPQPRTPRPPRWQKDRGHSQWPALVGGKPTRSIRPSYHHWREKGAKTTGGGPSPGQLCGMLVAGKSKHTQNFSAADAANWWS